MTSTSRDRMLAALACQPGSPAPCSFMLYNGLKASAEGYLDFIQRQLDLGLDAYVQLPPRPPRVVSDSYNLHGLPVPYPPDVAIREWTDGPLLRKEYRTPAGTLSTAVEPDDEWPYGSHVPFLDDFLVGRSRKFLVDGPADLPALQSLLRLPTPAESAANAAAFAADSAETLAFARARGLLTAGGWGVGADLIGWVYGLQNMIFAAHDQPTFIADLLALIAAWNRARMETVLSAGVDLYIKRGWYENADFWSPRAFRRFLQPLLYEEAALAHRRGARFGLIITSNCMSLLEPLAEAGVDVLIGADPHAWDLPAAAARLRGRVCLWGGVNGHLTVEQGAPEAVRAEVRAALKTFSPGGGLILSPVDNVRVDTPTARANVQALIAEWRAFTPDRP
jgi:hypothetical protein